MVNRQTTSTQAGTEATKTSREADLETIVNKRVSDLAWTKAALFKMAGWTKIISTTFDVIVVVLMAMLTVSLLRERLPTEVYILIAVSAASLSFLNLFLSWDKKYYDFKTNAESYNSLLKEFEEYYELTLKDETLSLEQKKSELEKLTQRHRQLNENTLETWSIAYNRLDSDKVTGDTEFIDIQESQSATHE